MGKKENKKEPTTYEVQEERYKKRLKLMELRGGLSPQELRHIANTPRIDRKKLKKIKTI